MSRLARRITRRTLLLSLATLAAAKAMVGANAPSQTNHSEGTVLSGGWLLKKSDLS